MSCEKKTHAILSFLATQAQLLMPWNSPLTRIQNLKMQHLLYIISSLHTTSTSHFNGFLDTMKFKEMNMQTSWPKKELKNHRKTIHAPWQQPKTYWKTNQRNNGWMNWLQGQLVVLCLQTDANQKRMMPSINCIDLTKASFSLNYWFNSFDWILATSSTRPGTKECSVF